MPRHKGLQSLLISIPTFVGTKDFSVIHVSAKCFFWVNIKSIEFINRLIKLQVIIEFYALSGLFY